MKKTIIYYILCLAIALVGGSCSDDEDAPVDIALLTGTWQWIGEYDSDEVGDGYDGWDYEWDGSWPSCMVIHEDHYGYRLYTPTDRNEYNRFTWNCSGNQFYYCDDRGETIWDIEKLTDEELLWRVDCYEDGYHWVEKELYRRYNP